MESNVKVMTLDELLGGLVGAQPAPDPEPVKEAPTLFGPKGRAWRLDLAKLREAAVARTQELHEDNIVASWIVERPDVNPLAHSFVVNLTALNGDHDHWTEGSTHEFSLFPIAPVATRDDMMSGAVMIPLIGNRGPIFAAQLTEDSHEAAIERINSAVQEVCDGDLVPDYDADGPWIERFGDGSLDPAFADRERKVKHANRYAEAMHGLEVAAAYAAAKEPRNTEPSYLRAGIDSVNISTTGLAKLLIDKGIISEADYVEAVADAAVDEYGHYARRLGLPPLEHQRAEDDAGSDD